MNIWKKLKESDLDELEKHANSHEPYCHLNIIDLWAYKVSDNYWFRLGDTIAYQLNSYNDNSLYTTLLGDKDVERTIARIVEESDADTITLGCVPDSVVNRIKDWGPVTNIREDHDNHDYIFDVLSIVTFSSNEMRHQSKKFKRLIRQHPQLHYELLNLENETDRSKIYEVFNKWVHQTGAKHWQKEYRALQRALSIPKSRLVCLGFYDGNKLIGYTVNRAENNNYYQAYFGKADRGYNPLSLYQEYSTASYMNKNFGSLYMNLQPDSGIDGLRKYKTSLGPSHKLQKFDVTIDAKLVRELNIQ